MKNLKKILVLCSVIYFSIGSVSVRAQNNKAFVTTSNQNIEHAEKTDAKQQVTESKQETNSVTNGENNVSGNQPANSVINNQGIITSNEHSNSTNISESVSIGGSQATVSVPTPQNNITIQDKTPRIVDYAVIGDVDHTKTGIDFYKNIKISLIGDNLTDKHFLTKEGLHWSDKTTVELISGEELGRINNVNIFGLQNSPIVPVTAYRNQVGDSGRITFVGKTISNEDLDLIWTITNTDALDWEQQSGFRHTTAKGIGFTGEQFIPQATGNSIVVLYNNAGNIGIDYKIVKHGTMVEMPVVLSFISTDIDGAQGVKTDLANITEIIPVASHLEKKEGIIYDTTPGVSRLNGSVDLPQGSYLGAGFLSRFNYNFYAPAPERQSEYLYPIAVRYDLFGSSLQAELLMTLQNHMTVHYIDEAGQTLKSSERYQGYQHEKYLFSAVNIPNYKLVKVEKDERDKNYPVIKFIYRPEYSVTVNFVDEQGKTVIDTKVFQIEKGQNFQYSAPALDQYITPSVFKKTITNDVTHTFVYKKEILPVVVKKIVEREVNRQRFVKKIVQTYYANTQKNTIAQPKQQAKTALKSKPYWIDVPDIYKSRDYFLENTGMTASDKEIFLNYIRNVANDSRAKHGNNFNKVNHDIANAIAYSTYYNNGLQKRANNYGEKTIFLTANVEQLFDKVRNQDKYSIDFPHLAAPIATAHQSDMWRETFKHIGGSSIGSRLGFSAHDIFFQLNSKIGDELTINNYKDIITNKDAYILYYHPSYKRMSLDKRIEQYYYIKNLDNYRDLIYQEAMFEHKQEVLKRTSPLFYNKVNTEFSRLLYDTAKNSNGGLWLQFDNWRKGKQQSKQLLPKQERVKISKDIIWEKY